MISSGIFSASTPGSGGGGIFTVTVSPASSRCEDFLAEPSTRTRPSSIRPCTCVRLISLRCVARKRSRRWPALSALTAKVSYPEESSSDSKWSCISDSARTEILRIGGEQHLARNRGACNGNGRLGRTLQPTPPKECPRNDQREANKLHKRDRIVEHHRASRIASEEFDGTALDPIEKEISAEDLSGEALAFAEPNENQKINKFRGGFVKLRGMQMNAERSSSQLRRCRIGERNTPGHGRRFAVTASRSKTTQAANSVTERQSCRQRVHYREQRHFLKIRIEANHQDGSDDTAVKSSPGLKRVQAENVARIGLIIIPVAQNKPDFRQEECNQDCIDPHVPDFVGIEAGAWRLPAGPPKSGQHARGNKHAVRVDINSADLKEDGMHR